jgi:hypothetical protein
MKSIIAVSVLAAALVSLPAQADFYDDVTPGNSFGTAVSIDSYFSLGFNPDVGDVNGVNTSTIMPWVSIWGQGDGAYDYFSFNSLGGKIILDVDYTYNNRANRMGFDSELALWRSNSDGSFTLVAENDDYDIHAGDGGSVHRYDAFIQVDNAAAGRYVVGVARYPASADNLGWTSSSGVIAADRQYGLEVSVSPVPEPGEWALMLSGVGLIGFIARRRSGKAG